MFFMRWETFDECDRFEVSDTGLVRNRKTGRLMVQGTVGKGKYPSISTKIGGRNGVYKCFKVHRMVLCTFTNEPYEYTGNNQVNHIDGDKANNHLSNLEWCTCKDNIQHSYDTGLKVVVKGWENKLSTLSETDYIKISEYKKRGLSNRKIAVLMGSSRWAIDRASSHIIS
jgi:hypothetical protein